MRPIFYLILFLLFSSTSSSRSQASEINPGKLLVTGSSTMCPLIDETGKHFESLHKNVKVEVQCGGSGRGVSDARDGKADIGMASRALTEKEKDLYGFPIARDGISVILHRDNPVNSLSNAQVASIYTGKIANWKEVGGHDARITVVNPQKGYSSVELFTHYFKIDYEDIKASVIAGDNPTRIKALVEDPNAIAYISAGEADRNARTGVPIKPLPFNNVMPTGRNIITGNYPITRPLILVTKELPKGVVKEFIDYCLSPAVVDLIEKFDFVTYMD